MNVIDLRDELYKRRIEIIEINDDCVYYAEELSENGEDRIYLYNYDFGREEERVLAFFALGSPDYIEHFYSCGESILILFENNTSAAWLIKVNKRSGAELFRKKISLIGRFFDCVPVDENDIIIYTRADDDSRELFNRCLETTNSETIANMYDLERGFRYFIKDFKTAELLEKGMHAFTTGSGDERLLLSDPYCGEAEKEDLVRALKKQLEDSGDELRDNIWVISKSKLLDAIKSGTETITLRRAASAGLEGTVRFESVCGENIIFRAKVYSSQLEQFFEMSSSNGRVRPLCEVRPCGGDSAYFTDGSNGGIYYLTRDEDRIKLSGEVGSGANFAYPERIGEIESCIDDRYIIADMNTDEPTTAIYDSRLGITDTFEARAKIKGRTVVLY